MATKMEKKSCIDCNDNLLKCVLYMNRSVSKLVISINFFQDFNLSSFLHNSPAKKPGNAPPISQMTTSQQSSNTVAISQLIVPTQSTASMLNDSSRDSILGKMDVRKICIFFASEMIVYELDMAEKLGEGYGVASDV